MKTAVIGYIMVMLLVLSGVAINTVGSKQIRQNELDSNLYAKMKKSLEILKVDSTPVEDEKLAADAVEGVLQGIKSNGDYEVHVYKADPQEGKLDMEVRGTYKQVLGEGKVSARRSIVYDDWKTKEQGSYTVVFMDDKDTLKELKCKANSSLTPEDLPKVQGERWKLNLNGKTYTEDTIGQVSVITNLTFVAVK